MTRTSTQQPEALRLAHTLSGGKLIDDSMEWADTLHAAAEELRRLHARITELEAKLAATLTTAAPAQEGWCDGCSPDNCVGCGPAAPAQVQPKQGEQL